MNSANTVFDAKRLIGRKYSDPSVQNDMKHWPFKVVDRAGKPMVQVEHKGETREFSAEEIYRNVDGTWEGVLFGQFQSVSDIY
mgnify:CR=1 FL=1